ncbi:hypothetical protein HDU76_001002 [Blyttiomyces sp. JEL0837]|nr:hypothetical protein HDU76_001002 [Blyttiomyces sp. JEL0837]
MTESKTELLAWLNDLLQLQYNRIEQCGTGAAFCQIMDSIYGDVPLNKVKFDSKHEYEYVNNYKILQTVCNHHGIEKNIQIDKLIKCRYNDNLEFLQWMKKYWDAFYPGGGYDAVARRAAKDVKAKPTTAVSKTRSMSPTKKESPTVASPTKRVGSATSATASSRLIKDKTTSAATPRSRGTGTAVTTPGSSRPASSQRGVGTSTRTGSQTLKVKIDGGDGEGPSSVDIESPVSNATMAEHEKVIADLTKQVTDLRCASDTLERERNFYYLKLRDLEVLVLERMERSEPEMVPLLRDIQNILYSTEEGFVSPKRRQPSNQPVPTPTTTATVYNPTPPTTTITNANGSTNLSSSNINISSNHQSPSNSARQSRPVSASTSTAAAAASSSAGKTSQIVLRPGGIAASKSEENNLAISPSNSDDTEPSTPQFSVPMQLQQQQQQMLPGEVNASVSGINNMQDNNFPVQQSQQQRSNPVSATVSRPVSAAAQRDLTSPARIASNANVLGVTDVPTTSARSISPSGSGAAESDSLQQQQQKSSETPHGLSKTGSEMGVTPINKSRPVSARDGGNGGITALAGGGDQLKSLPALPRQQADQQGQQEGQQQQEQYQENEFDEDIFDTEIDLVPA